MIFMIQRMDMMIYGYKKRKMNKSIYFEFNNCCKKDDQIFFLCQEVYSVTCIADGVSSCTNGRIASATICYALQKYFKNNRFDDNIIEYTKNAITESVKELKEVHALFLKYIISNSSSVDTFDLKDFDKSDDCFGQNSVIFNKLYNKGLQNPFSRKKSFLSISPALLGRVYKKSQSEYVSAYCKLNKKLNDIFVSLSEYNDKEYDNLDDYIYKIIKSVSISDYDSLEFQTTLSINIIRDYESFVELHSFNYGDSEILIISADHEECQIKSQLYQYKVQQGDLNSYICSKTGENGRLDVSMRRLYGGDMLLIGSDGTYFSKTAKASGNPYSPLQNIIYKCMEESALSKVPSLWCEKIRSMNVLDDDFSMFLVCIR